MMQDVRNILWQKMPDAILAISLLKYTDHPYLLGVEAFNVKERNLCYFNMLSKSDKEIDSPKLNAMVCDGWINFKIHDAVKITDDMALNRKLRDIQFRRMKALYQ